jgi:hypothetical protein
LPKRSQSSPQIKYQEEQLRLLTLIYQELAKLNANLAPPGQMQMSRDNDELDEYE